MFKIYYFWQRRTGFDRALTWPCRVCKAVGGQAEFSRMAGEDPWHSSTEDLQDRIAHQFTCRHVRVEPLQLYVASPLLSVRGLPYCALVQQLLHLHALPRWPAVLGAQHLCSIKRHLYSSFPNFLMYICKPSASFQKPNATTTSLHHP
jgi:hypothetical protein